MTGQSSLSFFYGRSSHKINAKGQVAVPARFRSVIPEETVKQGLVLLRGEEKCIYCYTHSQFRLIVDKVTSDEETGADADFLRSFFEAVYSVDLDSQGRMVIPAELREEVGIDGGEVVFIGHNDRVEIWSAGLHKVRSKETAAQYEEKRSRLSRRIFGP